MDLAPQLIDLVAQVVVVGLQLFDQARLIVVVGFEVLQGFDENRHERQVQEARPATTRPTMLR